jgi:ATP adenylyltransferase
MEQLWAPWRLSYVAAPKKPSGAEPCFICSGLAQERDEENLIVQRTNASVVLLNRFPYNNGHLLVAPRPHQGQLTLLDPPEMQDLMATLQGMVRLLDDLMHPDGYNIGLNQGSAAGAGLPGHLHWHVVPRWQGDTNFMPIVSDTRVIAQALDALYQLLHERVSRDRK